MPSGLLILVLVALLAVPLINLGFRWLVAPLIIRFKHRLAAEPQFQQVRAEELTPETCDFLAGVLPQFIREGFETVAHVATQGAVPGIDTTQVLLVNRITGDVGIVITVKSQLVRSLAFAVRSEFAGRTAVVTACSRDVSCFPRDPDLSGVSASWFEDATELCEFHRRWLADAGRAAERLAPPPGPESAVAWLEHEWRRENRRQASIGYTYLDQKAGAYRPTLKGAFLMVWKMTEPVKSWRLRLRDRNARRTWRRLGMDAWKRQAEPAYAGDALPAYAPSAASTMTTTTVPAPDDGLHYETSPAPGEINCESFGRVLTVRIGMPSRRQVLADHWYTLLSIAFFGCLLAMTTVIVWYQYQLSRRLGTRSLGLPLYGVWFYVPAIFLIVDIYKLSRAMVLTRGTTLINADPSGLTYRNAVEWRSAGSIARSDVEGLIVRHASGLLRKTYRLEVLGRAGRRRRIALAQARDRDALEHARAALARAMGIEVGVSAVTSRGAPQLEQEVEHHSRSDND